MELRRKIGVCLVILAIAPIASPEGSPITPDALDTIRQEALDAIEAGNRIEATHSLLNALRAIPPDKPELAAPAIGVIQLLLFTNEYLLSNEECAELYKNTFAPDMEKNPEVLAAQAMDRFVMLLMRYTDDAGMTQDEVNASFLELVRLSHCEHKAVRMGALFMLCDPYYLHENDMVRQSANRILEEFPGEYLAHEAQRLALYSYRKNGAEGLVARLEMPDQDGRPNPHMQRLQAGIFGQAVTESMQALDVPERNAKCVEKLARIAAQAADWPDEYAALNVMEGFHEGADAQKVRMAAAQAISRARNPKTVFRARIIRLAIARNARDMGAIMEDAHALLDTGDIPAVPDRNFYEDLKNAVQQSADKLAELGDGEKAAKLLERLAARFPNTLLASQMQEKIAALRAATIH